MKTMNHEHKNDICLLTVTPHRVFVSSSSGASADQFLGSLDCIVFPTIHLLSLASHLEAGDEKEVVNDLKNIINSGFSP